MADKQLMLDIEDALALDDAGLAAQKLAELREVIDPAEGILTSQIHRYYLQASLRVHGVAGNFDQAVRIVKEALECTGVIMSEGRIHPEKLAEVEGKFKPLIHKTIRKYFDLLLLLGKTSEYKHLYQECLRAEGDLKAVIESMAATDPSLKELPRPKKEPQGLLVLEINGFEETEQQVSVNLTLLKEDPVTIELDSKAPNQLSFFNPETKVTQTVNLAGNVTDLIDKKQEGRQLSLQLKKEGAHTWRSFILPIEQTAPVNQNPNTNEPTSDKQLAKKKENPYLANKNWDKIVAEEEANSLREKDYDGADPAMHFFKEIYANADEDTKRAMMRSYLESDGRALSTNWKEVATKDYKKEFAEKKSA